MRPENMDQSIAELKPAAEMTLVEIAESLEKVTSWIEAQRVRERDARAAYQAISTEVEANVQRIRQYAQQLLEQQRRKVASFDGLLGVEVPAAAANGRAHASARTLSNGTPNGASLPEPRNIAEAILGIWNVGRHDQPLTTEEIAAALPEVGYRSDAATTSLRSSVNQALAKLCRVGRVVRFRNDGSRIPIRDTKSRARRYLAASRLSEVIED